MQRFTPDLQLRTLFVLNAAGRIISTREPDASSGPRFCLIRGKTECAWALHAETPDAIASELSDLLRTERPTPHFLHEPVHATALTSLVGGRVDSGPAFTFPDSIATPSDIVAVAGLSQLTRHFRGWTTHELPERAPIMAITDDEGNAMSVCFCARQSSDAAEAGLDTAEQFRGRGFGRRVAAAWALAIRESGRLPIYSTSWSNTASLAVARKLGLDPCASDWSLWS